MLNSQEYLYSTIETERFIMKVITLADAEQVFSHFSDENVTKYMDIEPCKDLNEAVEIIQYHLDDSGCRWGIFDKNNHQFMGTCGFHYLRKEEQGIIAEVGFDLSITYWGKGYMQEIMHSIIDYGFTNMNLTMIDATVEQENEPSIKLLTRLGFKRDDALRDNLLYFYLTNER